MWIEAWTLAIAVVTAVSCALCGSLLLVARKSMVSEGLSHAVLPGLVLAFVLTRDYNSPWLILSAAASGMIMVWLTQVVSRSGLVDDDAECLAWAFCWLAQNSETLIFTLAALSTAISPWRP